MSKRVSTIPATINRTTRQVINSTAKRRVAAYARVSTDNEEQLTSYEAQVDYYTNYIKSRDDWDFVKVYTDEGISGTNTKKRLGFQAMIKDALAGKIDLIVTKSVSRFARNTVDSLTTIRELKNHNVECYFEKENINTFDGKGELLLTIMSSLAQEESRSISENVTWGQRKRFADGKVCVPYSRFLGYDKGEDGNLSLNEDEAKTIRLIYKLFLEGLSFYSIAKELTNKGIKSPGHKDKWNRSAVESILTNEKYKGDALLQKSYTVDFLTKKHKKNEGEIPQYYVEDNHEAIVSKEVFEMVQQEIKKRTKGGKRYSGVGIFGSKIKCMECGSWFGAKVWHSNDKYKRVIYRCNHKYGNKKVCETQHLTEDEIKEISVKAINKVIKNKKEIIGTIENVISKIGNLTNLNKKKLKYEQELKVITELTEEHINKNKITAQNQKAYNEKYDELVKQYDETKSKYELLVQEISIEMARKKSLEKYISDLKKQKTLIKEFDKMLFAGFIEEIDVYKDKKVVVFRDGKKIEV